MILYAAYVKGALLEQIPAESEDTAFSKLKLDYPVLKSSEVTFEVIDPDYHEIKESIIEDTEDKEEEDYLESAEVVEEKEKSTTTKSEKPFTVIEADSIEITVNVSESSISKEDLDELQNAAENGLLVAKSKES